MAPDRDPTGCLATINYSARSDDVISNDNVYVYTHEETLSAVYEVIRRHVVHVRLFLLIIASAVTGLQV